jgi:AbrB family looped-hinge helix DNA binding protein
MTTVTISPLHQAVIPKKIRERMGIKAGQKLRLAQRGRCIELVPVISFAEARGMLKGMGISSMVHRDDDPARGARCGSNPFDLRGS